jgi:DNA-binding NtrC family response regulator
MQNDFHPGKVLVVEDHDLERETLLALLRRAGHSAWGVGDAQSALSALGDLEHEGDDIDVVLCDLRLNSSSQTGVDLLRQWKDRRPSTPFIFVTGVYEIAQVVEAVKLGAEDYITKPYNSAELLRRVAECIEASCDNSTPAYHARDSVDVTDAGFELPEVSLEELERLAIEGALRRSGDNRTHAANALGISVRTLQRKLKLWAAGVPGRADQVAENLFQVGH